MSWNSAADFWAMGGYGLYVWGSIAMCAVVLAAEVWVVSLGRARLRRELQDERPGDRPGDRQGEISESSFQSTK